MKLECPQFYCQSRKIIKRGYFVRASDSKRIPRFSCKDCKKCFSSATNTPTFRQHKRRLNSLIFKLLSSGNSQRRMAKLLRCNLKTIARKLIFLSSIKNYKEEIDYSLIEEIQFDEMETSLHTKLRPVSILLVVEKYTRKILDVRLSQMPAKGLLTKRSLKRYGKIKDRRPQMLNESFENLQTRLGKRISIESDESPRYTKWVKKYFPEAMYNQHKGQRGCTTGQGELKAVVFDPLFSLNHTCAMFRANVNRLFRKTWCTTKKMDRLQAHLNLYSYYHNKYLV